MQPPAQYRSAGNGIETQQFHQCRFVAQVAHVIHASCALMAHEHESVENRTVTVGPIAVVLQRGLISDSVKLQTLEKFSRDNQTGPEGKMVRTCRGDI